MSLTNNKFKSTNIYGYFNNHDDTTNSVNADANFQRNVTVGGDFNLSGDIIDASGNSISNSILRFLDATSSIQTQLNEKTSLPNVESNNNVFSGNCSFVNDISCNSIDGISRNTLSYLDATSSIQTQLNEKLTSDDLTNMSSFPTISTGSLSGTRCYWNSPVSGVGGSSFLNLSQAGGGGFWFYNSNNATAPTLLFIINSDGSLQFKDGTIISNTIFSYLTGISSNIQTQLNNTTSLANVQSNNNNFTGNCSFVNDISCNSIDGVSRNTLSYLDATSSIQTQLNNTTSLANVQSNNNNFTGNCSFINDISCNSIDGISRNTLSYLDATSSIQTQLNNTTSLANVQSNNNIFSGNCSFINDISCNSIDGISRTTLSYLSGLSSSIQTQLNGKLTSTDLTNTGTFPTTSTGGLSGTRIYWNSPVGGVGGSTFLNMAQGGGGGFYFYISNSASAPFLVLRLYGDGSLQFKDGTTISNAIFSYLTGLSSNVQSQINSKTDLTSIQSNNNIFSGNCSFINDISCNSIDGISRTTLSYLSGLSSSVQSQLNSKTDLTSIQSNNNTFTGVNNFSNGLSSKFNFVNNSDVTGLTSNLASSSQGAYFQWNRSTGQAETNIINNSPFAPPTASFIFQQFIAGVYNSILFKINNDGSITFKDNTTISNTIFSYLSGISSNIQSQLNSLSSSISSFSSSISSLNTKTTDISYSSGTTTISNDLRVNGSIITANCVLDGALVGQSGSNISLGYSYSRYIIRDSSGSPSNYILPVGYDGATITFINQRSSDFSIQADSTDYLYNSYTNSTSRTQGGSYTFRGSTSNTKPFVAGKIELHYSTNLNGVSSSSVNGWVICWTPIHLYGTTY